MLAGMALTFAGFATLVSAGGAWAVRVNEYGRLAALLLLAVFGLSLHRCDWWRGGNRTRGRHRPAGRFVRK
jgi:hypothetical protein